MRSRAPSADKPRGWTPRSLMDWREPNEAADIATMTDVLRRKMERDYAKGQTKRDAHPKTLGILRGKFRIESDVPSDLAVGLFSKPGAEYDCWLRYSNANGAVRPDTIPDQRGLGIKLLVPGTEKALGQDYVLLSNPTIPLGTIRLFRDAVYHAIETSIVILIAKFLFTGKLGKLKEIKAARNTPPSLFEIPFYSTTPYLLGPECAVKYALFPATNGSSQDGTTDPHKRSADYLADEMEQRFARGEEAEFRFCIQPREGDMPIDDAAVRWDEQRSPFIQVATLRIPVQIFRTPEREALGEALAFSPGHALPEHAPLGGLNRARIAIYKALATFRHERDGRPSI